MKVRVIVHPQEDGGFWAEVPSLPGCATQGDTWPELLENLYEAIQGVLSVGDDATPSEPNVQVFDLAI